MMRKSPRFFRKTRLVLAGSLALLIAMVFTPNGSTPALEQGWSQAEKNARSMSERKRRLQGALGHDQPDRFGLFHKAIRTRAGEQAPDYPVNYRVQELFNARRRAAKRASDPLPWLERGPGNVAGRARVILVDPDDQTHNTWYVGSASGGVWKTTDAGTTWRELTRSLPNLATTTLAMSPAQTNVLYAGTGEGFGTFAFVYGQGIWKSTDKGETWAQLASTANEVRFTNIMRLIVDPDDAETLVAATSTGARNNQGETSYLFRSTDGGDTWTQVHTSPVDGSQGRIEQVVADPQDFDIQYATVNATGVLKSTDGGQTWTDASDGLDDLSGRLELAVAPSAPENLYVAAEGGGSGSILYASVDRGETWDVVVGGDDTGLDWMDGQGFYDNTIAVHPFDPNVVFVGGIDIHQIDVDSGELEPVTDSYGQYGGQVSNVHVDHHQILLVPTDLTNETFLFLNANDGGVAFSRDGGASFTQSGDAFAQGGPTLQGLNTSQFYGIDKANGTNRYLGGTQDNGSWVSPEGADARSVWVVAPSGDGFEAAWHYHNPEWLIETSQFNSFFRSTNGGQTWDELALPGDGPFLTRLGKSNQDPDLLFAVNDAGVLRSEDFGTTWTPVPLPQWELDTGVGNATVRISLASPAVVWTGSQLTPESPLYVSTDGGQTFETTGLYDEATMGAITDIATHPSDAATAYALFSFAGAPKILRTTDRGQTWEDLSGFGAGSVSTNGFPDVATYSLLVMPFDENRLWAGTEIGLFESTDGGQTWSFADTGLPAVSVWQMRIVNDEVVVATHGRGIWSVSLPELAGYEPDPVLLGPVIASLQGGIGGDISLSVLLRSAYDSTLILIDQQRVHRFEANTGRLTQSINLTRAVMVPTTVTVQAVAYVDGQEAPSSIRQITLIPVVAPQASFSTDFNDASLDFLLDGFTVETVDGFDDGALHSLHPYPDQQELIAGLLTPLVVSSDNATLRYDDVAFIEPGEEGVPFGEEGFFDFVVVEGSNDNGLTWQPLADGYDVRFDDNWFNNTDSTTPGSAEFFVPHEIDLLDTFAPGETILIRFRLFADEALNGWGWAIDNLEIQAATGTAVQDEAEAPARFTLAQNYPNPFNPVTTIAYTVPETAPVELFIFDVAGRRVRTLVALQQQQAGAYRVTWDGRNDAGTPVASGLYMYQLRAGRGFVQTNRMVLLK